MINLVVSTKGRFTLHQHVYGAYPMVISTKGHFTLHPHVYGAFPILKRSDTDGSSMCIHSTPARIRPGPARDCHGLASQVFAGTYSGSSPAQHQQQYTHTHKFIFFDATGTHSALWCPHPRNNL